MLLPKRVKYRRVQRGRLKGQALRGNTVSNGDFGLQALEPAWITSNQIEAARVAMTRYIKRGGQVWIKIFPDKPISKKPAGTRMGSGKGAPEYWVAVVKPGRVMFEIGGVADEVAREALRLAARQPDQNCSRQKGYRKSKDSSPRDRTERRRFVRKGRHAVMSERNLRKTRVGMVVSDKMDKTVVVAIRDNVKHPLYKKIIKNTVKFKAHDENNECRVGDRVLVMETRPLSKDKRWRVVEIVEKAK